MFYSSPVFNDVISAGRIYAFLPIPWLRPPVWLLRYLDWTHGQARLTKSDQNADAFRLASQANQEWLLAEAKIRPVIIFHTPSPHSRAVPVIPVYSFAEHKNQDFLSSVRAGRYPDKFYLPASTEHDLKEAYADFGLIQPVDREFLKPELQQAQLTVTAWQALLTRYSQYLLGR